MTTTPGYRVRERGGFTPGAARRYAVYQLPAAPNWINSTPHSIGRYEAMSDYVTPRFLELSRKGAMVNKPMSLTRTERSTTVTGPRFTLTGANSNWKHAFEGPWHGGLLTNFAALSGRSRPYSIEKTIDIARTRCIANVAKPDFEGLVTLGEIRQTIGYLRNPFKTGLQLASTLERKMLGMQALATKRGRPDDKLRKNLSDLHLEIIYGFKPLVKDIFGILEQLRDKVNPKPQRQTARAKEENTYSDVWTLTESFSDITYTASYEYLESVVVRPWILYENTIAPTVLDEWGFRLQDIPGTAWELVPLSFLVDRFVNIGDFLSAMVPRVGTRQLCSGYSVRTKRTLTRQVSNYKRVEAGQPAPNWVTELDGTGKDTLIEETYYRVPGIGVPALVMLDIESVIKDVGLLASMLSLTTQKLSNLSRNIPPPPKVLRLSRAVGARDKWLGRDHL